MSSSQHEDHRIFHGTVNAQNRSNYEVKYHLIRQIPLGIIAISSFFNFFVKDNWNWGIGAFSLGAIIASLITLIFLYLLLECAISVNMESLEINAKNKSLPADQQLKEEPASKEKYDCLNKYTRGAYITSISFCILLTITIGITIGVTQMSATKTKSQTTEAVTPEQANERLGIVTKPIVPEGNPDIKQEGIVSSPIVPEGSNPVTTAPPPEQPTGNDGGGQNNSPSTPETQTPVSQSTDGSNKN